MGEKPPPERFGLTCLDAAGRGVGVVVPLRTVAARPPSDEELMIWGRVAAHVANATRLRRAGALGGAAVEAVIEPGGRIEHAEGVASRATAREALRVAAVAQDRARSSRGRQRDAITATAQWSALVAGRWSLVDTFERDGRRYLLARSNEPAVLAGAGLTRREAQVAAYAALGHANKQIAYELGLAEATVAGHLTRAAVKLGARSRPELIRALKRGPCGTP